MAHPGRVGAEAAGLGVVNQPTVNLGFTGSASAITGDRLSGINTRNTPPNQPHAASQPAITAPKVWVKLNHTNMCRE